MATRKHVQLSSTALAGMDPAELEAAGKLGARRFRRWANDRILRDLAGKLTAEDMQGLFSPVPFGNTPVKSALQQAAEPRAYAIWESFISIDMDRQARVLQKWEAHILEERRAGRPPSKVPPEVKAVQAWGRVSRKARNALRQASPQAVEALEGDVLRAKQEGRVVLFLSSSFQRLLVHGIAEYHGMLSTSRTEADGTRATYVKTRTRQPSEAAPIATEQEGFLIADVLCLLHDDRRESGDLWVSTPQQAYNKDAYLADDSDALPGMLSGRVSGSGGVLESSSPSTPELSRGSISNDWVII